MKERLGLIGIGRMGRPMAISLLDAGWALRVYNRTPEKSAALCEQGAESVYVPCDVVEPGGIVITMVSDDEALKEVTFGAQGFGERLGQGGIHLSMSTLSPALAEQLAAYHAARGGHYVAAPVFGRPEAAAARKLWICLSGDEAAKSRVRPLLSTLGQGIFDFGLAPAAAHVVKLAGNLLLVTAIEAMAEALTLAEGHHLDSQQVAEMLTQTIFACPVYQSYSRTLTEKRYQPAGFSVALALKDVSLMHEAAHSVGLLLPATRLVKERLREAVSQGYAEFDCAALVLGLAVSDNKDAPPVSAKTG